MRLSLPAAEEMISLSRLIKSGWTVPAPEKQKVISIKSFQPVGEDSQSPTVLQLDAQQKAILDQAKEKADLIINEASLMAQSIQEKILLEKEAWEQEKQLIAKSAQETGFQSGVALGKEQGFKEWEEAIKDAQEVISAARRDYHLQIAAAEKTILHLGIKVAEKIIGSKINENEETFLSIVKRALKEAKEYREIQLHVSPSHYEFISAQKDELLAIFPKETDMYIYPDEKLAAGNCIIESTSGKIDATIDNQLHEIKTKLLEILEGEGQ